MSCQKTGSYPPALQRTSGRRSLVFHLVLWSSLSLLLAAAVMVLAHSSFSRTRAEEDLQRLARQLAATLARDLAVDVWEMDETAIAAHFAEFPWSEIGLIRVEVLTELDDVLFEKQYAEEGNLISHRAPILRKDAIIGYVQVYLSTGHLQALQNAIGMAGVMIIVPGIAVIFIVLALIVTLIVVRPMKATIAGVRRIASGDYEHVLEAARTSEIDQLNVEINTMAAEIRKRQQELTKEIDNRISAQKDLQELNVQLEERIQERTSRLQRLASMLDSAQDAEQQRIAEGLHDDVAQLLAAARMKMAIARAAPTHQEAKERLEAADKLLSQAYEHLRLLSFELASSALYRWGLVDSLEKLCGGMNERYGASFSVVGTTVPGLMNDSVGSILFKAARECLFNVVKHSGTLEATVRLARSDGHLSLSVEDKGKGFEPGQLDVSVGRGLGLFAVTERLRDVNGEISISSVPNERTTVTVTVPFSD